MYGFFRGCYHLKKSFKLGTVIFVHRSPSFSRKRWFCCPSYLTGIPASFDRSKIICKYNKERVTCSNVVGDKCKSGEDRIPSAVKELLGIEVYPEIFDQLPCKCTGCGVILQSDNVQKPGFIPSYRNPNIHSNIEANSLLPAIICQRCFNLMHYSQDVGPMVPPEATEKFLKHISRRKALILYVVNVMDIPGCFIENIMEIVGETKHVILVINKLDSLPVDGKPKHQIERLKRIILDIGRKHGLAYANILDVVTISAKTGFGVKNLVRTIKEHWRKNSDVYLVGCNNSGKTTLFNLLKDLFASSRSSENMFKRGVVGPSVGTTLSLLRYPITKYRFQRLGDRLRTGVSEKMINDKEMIMEVDLDDDIIDKSLTKYRDVKDDVLNTCAAVSPYHQVEIVTQQESKETISWLYDTPGLFNKNQLTHILRNEELKLLNPALWFVPRTVIMRPGQVMFLGGLARLDYLHITRKSLHHPNKDDNVLKASQYIFFTIFASPNLPVHVTSCERATKFYDQHVGEEILKIPCGDESRMKNFPQLKGKTFEVMGKKWRYSAADIVLSDVAWVAVTAGSASIVSIKAYTPNGAGLFLREPALLPTSVQQRGRRGVPYLGHVNRNMYQGTRKKSPSLMKYFAKETFGTIQWMKIADKKRKKQRALLKFAKTQYYQKLGVGYSARSNPRRYLPVTNDQEFESKMLQNE